jgi:RNA polymerase sigma-70 factor (ECF subfamily)
MNGPVQAHADMALAERCRANAPGAFEELYRTHAPRLFGLICRLAGRVDAEDLLQETFLSAHRKLGSYRGESALGTWLFRMATNLCIDHLRGRGSRWSQLTEGLDEAVAGPAASVGPVLGAIDRMDLERAIAALPPGARVVFVLHDIEGFDHREIGDLVGVSDGTSKSQLHRARMRLREMLAGHRLRAMESA